MSTPSDDTRRLRENWYHGDTGSERNWRQCTYCFVYAESSLHGKPKVTHQPSCPVGEVERLEAAAVTPEGELTVTQKLHVLIAEVGRCIHDDDLMKAHRKLRAMDELLRAVTPEGRQDWQQRHARLRDWLQTAVDTLPDDNDLRESIREFLEVDAEGRQTPETPKEHDETRAL